MMDQLALLWRFLQLQPWTRWFTLVPWHLLAVLFVLGVLSAFGLHFLVGHVFGYYRRKGRPARWVGWPSAVVFLVSVQVLLGAYLLGVRAPELVRANLTGGVTSQLGRLLLAPAFKRPALVAQPDADVSKGALTAAVRSFSELDYRAALVSEQLPLAKLRPGADGDAGPRGPDALVQLGLRWVTAPHSTWQGPEAGSAAKAGASQAERPFFLPDFLVGLVDELPSGTVLPRLDWEHVAGTRFVEGVLRPLMEEYLAYLAALLAALVVLIDVAFFLLMGRLKRIGQPKAARKAPATKAAALPAPAKAAAASPPAPTTSETKPAGETPSATEPAAPKDVTAPAAGQGPGEGTAAAPAENAPSSDGGSLPAATPSAEGGSPPAPTATEGAAAPVPAPAPRSSVWRLFKR